jgi:23S rRNA (uridine2552-2'-O)-methyltransferase
VVASDILPMDGLAGVTFIEGDFTREAVFEQILAALGDKPIDLVISDMAPNMSGVNAVDQPRVIYLVELALDMAQRVLAPGGGFVAKLFHGEGFDQVFQTAKGSFSKVLTRKPKASRPRSREVYMVAKEFRGR